MTIKAQTQVNIIPKLNLIWINPMTSKLNNYDFL